MRSSLSFVAGLMLAVGCGGPSVTVWHDDSAEQQVEVRVNQEVVGYLDFGEAFQIYVDEGYHFVEAYPAGSDSNPWAEDGRGWLVYVNEDTQLTLFEEQPGD